ncbi:tail fiber protein [Salmonella enterica]|nr:tail fiber protein [Salmonella enterica]EHK5999305.1 tail fiber protein [Salmonella enterica]EIF5127484.1 tail fiber protein [Salmonella enterica]EIF5348704.1 tail fiber protein [Salmonella enterica]EIF5657300.1 tail fiber protein [Salmonella enterica]
MGEGSALPVGVPVPWPLATPPDGWLKYNGAAFDKVLYPKLAAVYPSGILPDLRGEFIRGWDDGRGIDPNRTLLVSQLATGIRTAALDYFGVDETKEGATIGTAFVAADSFANQQPPDAMIPSGAGPLVSVMTDNSMTAMQNPTSLSNPYGGWITMRPRNVAFNYIVRAA